MGDAPSKARIRRAGFLAAKKISKTVRDRDDLDGCELDLTEDTTSDDDLEALLDPEPVQQEGE